MTATRLFDRALIRLSAQDDSEDVFAFLQGLVTNDVSGKLPAYAALLSAQGKTMFDMFVWPSGDGGVLLDNPAVVHEQYPKGDALGKGRGCGGK